jgi:hypothetical protein
MSVLEVSVVSSSRSRLWGTGFVNPTEVVLAGMQGVVPSDTELMTSGTEMAMDGSFHVLVLRREIRQGQASACFGILRWRSVTRFHAV